MKQDVPVPADDLGTRTLPQNGTRGASPPHEQVVRRANCE